MGLQGAGLSRTKPAKGTRVGNKCTVNITIDPDLLEHLQSVAQAEYLSLAAVVRRYLRAAIKAETPTTAKTGE